MLGALPFLGLCFLIYKDEVTSPTLSSSEVLWLKLKSPLGFSFQLWASLRTCDQIWGQFCRFQDKWGLCLYSWCPVPVPGVFPLCLVRLAITMSMVSPAPTSLLSLGSWNTPTAWPGRKWHSRSGRVGGQKGPGRALWTPWWSLARWPGLLSSPPTPTNFSRSQ